MEDNNEPHEISVEMDGVGAMDALFMCCAFVVGVCKNQELSRKWLTSTIEYLWNDEEIDDSAKEINII